jgi:hypothetical protein
VSAAPQLAPEPFAVCPHCFGDTEDFDEPSQCWLCMRCRVWVHGWERREAHGLVEVFDAYRRFMAAIPFVHLWSDHRLSIDPYAGMQWRRTRL